jgi:glycosyltransferase involved in cell wall biosynthesis
LRKALDITRAGSAATDALNVRLLAIEKELGLYRTIAIHTRGLAQAQSSDRLISVIMPTSDRPEQLEYAVRSVLAQTHRAWELLVIDDSGTADSAVARVVAAFDDDRIRVLATGAGNQWVARNAALKAARGDLIAYLEDDHFWFPEWLAAVADAFARNPDAPLVYGAFCGEDARWLSLPDWNRPRLERANYIDQNVIAHPRDHSEAHFDDGLEAAGDWDLTLRLTDGTPGVPVPVAAAGYLDGVPDRMSDDPAAVEASRQSIRRRVRASRPLRVLGFNAQFPLISETYILDELEALARNGAELGFVRNNCAVAPMRLSWPLWPSLDAAVAEWEPDVIVMHWALFAIRQLRKLERYGVPFAVRTHGFDVDAATVEKLRAHPLCIGVWAYPTVAQGFPGTIPLPLLFTSVDRLPPPRESRDLLLSVSAGLPKKDFDLLFDAFGRLTDVERRVVVAGTQGHEAVPRDLLRRCQAFADPPLVQVNLPRTDVFELLARTALFVYVLRANAPFGMPMSVTEAMAAGCSVALPDRPAARAFAGPSARYYSTADELVTHARTVLAGGHDVERERRANREWALERHCALELGDCFYEQLSEAVADFPDAPTTGNIGDVVRRSRLFGR